VVVVAGCASAPQGPVRPGIDVLLTDSLALVRERRVGLLTNQTGVDARGVDDVTRLVQAGVQLTAIFSPEHGFRGHLDEENIDHGVDSATGTRIYSLYGAVRAPTAAMLADLDVLLIDLQDIGGRTYTFVSTALLAVEAATTAGVAVVVLDRPNPIGGTLVQGPVLDTALRSFIGMLPVPLRHGMTIGELVRFGNAERSIGAALTVVPAAGWRRAAWFDETGLPWVRPSPSMPNLESASHYPGLVLFEATNLSVGRGTPVAFQVVAAPWLDAAAVAASLAARVVGVEVVDTVVIPDDPPDGKFDGVQAPAIKLRVRDRAVYDPIATAVQLLHAIHTAHPTEFELDSTRFDQRAGTRTLRAQVRSGEDPASAIAAWSGELETFRERRDRWLLYR
jgi:uncharacterized protein YbbC (DUF1343 family)